MLSPPLSLPWQLDAAKSKFASPGKEVSETRTYDISGGKVSMKSSSKDPSGKELNFSYSAGVDGKSYPMVGNPNAGKSTLFNALSGLRQRVGNYPGVTVEMKKGHFTANGVVPPIDWSRQHEAPTENDIATHGAKQDCLAYVTVGAGGTVTPSSLAGPAANNLASPGTLTAGDMVWQSGGTYRWYVASAFEGPYTNSLGTGEFIRYLIFAGLGLIVMQVLARGGLHLLNPRVVKLMLIASTVLLLLVLAPGIGVNVNGARRWFAAGPVQFQPSELLKLSLVLYVAQFLAKNPKRIGGPGRARIGGPCWLT